MGVKTERLFVGREQELNQFKEVLRDPSGQAVFVIGDEGMGKSLLLARMARESAGHPELLCGFVNYEITPVKSANALMEEMMHHALEAACFSVDSSVPPKPYPGKWLSFFHKILPEVESPAELSPVLRYEPNEDIQQQFLERLDILSRRMPEKGRGIFFIDAGRKSPEQSDEVWAEILKNLPPKIKFVFAQRPYDVLAASLERATLRSLQNAVKITIGLLDGGDVRDLVNLYSQSILHHTSSELEDPLTCYEGHPYNISAALEMLRDGERVENLPRKKRPEEIANAQWRRVSDEHGYDAIRLFEAFSILEEAVPGVVVDMVSALPSTTRKRLLDNPFLFGLTRWEGVNAKIYHGILRDHILKNVKASALTEYHRRAVEIYRRLLYDQARPDELAAKRLTGHMMKFASREKVIYSFINESTPILIDLGLYETAIDYTKQLLKMSTATDKIIQAALHGNLGVIYRSQGRLEQSEKIQRKALDINRKIKHQQGMAYAYINLGEIYQIRGKISYAKSMYLNGLNISNRMRDAMGMIRACTSLGSIYMEIGQYDQAERTIRQALTLNEKMGNHSGAALQYGNLGRIYQKCGNLEKARNMLRKAQDVHQKTGNMTQLADNYHQLGSIYHQEKELRKAGLMYNKALEIYMDMGNLEGLADLYADMAGIHLEQEKYEKAGEFLARAADLYERLNKTDRAEEIKKCLDALPVDPS